jgi:hypothetical protein
MANPIDTESTDTAVAAVKGENMNGGTAVLGISATGYGVVGESTSGRGVVARSDTNYGLRAASRTSAGIRGSSEEGRGVEGWSTSSEGVVGISTKGNAVWGQAEGGGTGLLGTSKTGIGVLGQSESNEGVRGVSRGRHAGVVGINDSDIDPRLAPVSLRGESNTGGNGGWFESNQGEGVRGWSKNSDHGGVVGVNSAKGIGVYAASDEGVGIHAKGGRLAGFFEGNVEVTGDIQVANADCAEDFDIADTDSVEPGTVMVLGDDGTLHESHQPYDKRVAGVISGAGDYKPAIVLDKQHSDRHRKAIALLGKVYCKVDARFGSIEVGDMLTTSPSLGHAMKASDQSKAFGAVIGKALCSHRLGQGLIPILVALQ